MDTVRHTLTHTLALSIWLLVQVQPLLAPAGDENTQDKFQKLIAPGTVPKLIFSYLPCEIS